MKVPRHVAAMAVAICLLCPAIHAQITTLASTPGAGDIGVAADPGGNAVYYTEWNTGSLKRIQLTPTCTSTSTPACVVTTVASGFSHPQDVALDLAHNAAYVTTRDDPGTSGALWRVDLTTGTRSLVTFNLLAPHQISLDIPTNSAYVVGFGTGAPNSGRLWRVNLTTGGKTTILSGLNAPVGLLVTADRTRAYVTEQGSSSIVSVDVALRARIGTVVSGLVQPFYMAWADPGQVGFYVARRAANDVVRVDLPTSTSSPVMTGLPSSLPSGVAVNAFANAAYLTNNDSVIRYDLGGLPLTSPVFLGVGNVPSTAIASDGYATTPPGYFVHFKDSPFGGTLNIFGNFTAFRAAGASQYRVNVSKDGASPTAVTQTWTMARFNTATGLYESATIAPISGTDRYLIPSEYPGNPERWYPAFLMMRWPTGPNGLYAFTVELFDASGSPLPPIASGNLLTLKVDNDAPDVDLVAIYQHLAAAPVGACAIVTTGTTLFDVRLRAYDVNGHMLSYSSSVVWGHNLSATVIPTESYEPGHVNADGFRLWRGVSNLRGPAAGWNATCNCAHTFYVNAWKRTIDGYGYIIHRNAHQSITIMNTGTTCPP